MSKKLNETIDVFISYASEDADDIARPLAEELSRRRLRVWFAEYSLSIGDGLREKINKGLASCRFGVVILSKAFFAKQWTKFELDGLTTREITEAKKIILPVWHQLERDEVARYSPILADRLAVSTKDGLASVADKIVKVLFSPHDVLDDQTILTMADIDNYTQRWKREHTPLDESLLNVLFGRRTLIPLSGDTWLMIFESACENRQARRWVELVSQDAAWLGLKLTLLESPSSGARTSAGKLLNESFATNQGDYEETVLQFLNKERNIAVLESAIVALAESKRQTFCPFLTKRLLTSSNDCDETSLRCVIIEAICRLCLQSTVVQTLDTWLSIPRFWDRDLSTAINALGTINDTMAIERLKKLLSEGFFGNEATGEEYIRCLATSLAKLGISKEEIVRTAGFFAVYLWGEW